MVAPLLNDHLGFFEGVEAFAIKAFVPELSVEALVQIIGPGAYYAAFWGSSRNVIWLLCEQPHSFHTFYEIIQYIYTADTDIIFLFYLVSR